MRYRKNQQFEDNGNVGYSRRAVVMRRWWNGIHVRSRGVCLTAWGFESPPAHIGNCVILYLDCDATY